MQQLGEYVLSLTAAAMICSGVLYIVRGGLMEKLLRVICGVYLSVTMLSPLSDAAFPPLSNVLTDYQADAQRASMMGERLALQKRNEDITHHLEAYILDKASLLGVDLVVSLTLDDAGMPICVVLSGDISEKVQLDLSEQITQELGITKENQKWTG